MKTLFNFKPVVFCMMLLPTIVSAQNKNVFHLWPKGAPGEAANPPAEKNNTKPTDNRPGNKDVIRLTNVSDPTITVYPATKNNSGAAVIVCPGGGYSILAIDLEGSEICEYLNTLGITAVLLKYRVPVTQGRPRYQAPLQDAQRAMGWIRYNAAKWNIDPGKIGIMGFSAGGHLSAALSNNYDTRTYEKMDEADNTSCRPDFTILIYPAYLTVPEEGDKIAPELPITSNTPPAFIVQTNDDGVRVENAIFYNLALKKAKVASELHVFAKGGHGYGMRSPDPGVSTWPQRLREWLISNKIIK